MSNIGRELRQFSFDIAPRAIPVDKSSSYEAVAKVLESWPTTAAFFSGRRTQAYSARERGECLARGTRRQALATFRNEESLCCSAPVQPVTFFCIARQSLASRIVDRNETGFSELSLANGQNTSFQIHVRLVESQCFLWAQACGGEESDEGFVRDGP